MPEEEFIQADQHEGLRQQPRVRRSFGELNRRTGTASGGRNVAPHVPGKGKSLLDLTQTSAGSLGLEAGEERGPAATVRVA